MAEESDPLGELFRHFAELADAHLARIIAEDALTDEALARAIAEWEGDA